MEIEGHLKAFAYTILEKRERGGGGLDYVTVSIN